MITDMNIKEKITLSVGVLVSLIVALVALSVISLQILTATEPTSPVADYGLTRALTLLLLFGALSISIGVWMLVKLPSSVNRPFQKLTQAINEIANHNYDVELSLAGSQTMEQLSANFNRMARRLRDYHNSSISKLRVSKQYIETIIDSIDEPIICIDNEPLKIYADNKESYFQVKYLPVRMTDHEGSVRESGTVVMLKNITEFHKLDVAKTTFISTISHELKTPISAILMSQQLLADSRVGALNPEQKELSDSIKDNGERLLSITGELLNMTQVESGALQLKPHITKPIELIDYAIKANQVQADKFHINIEVDYPKETIRKLYVDSEKIAWVLTNLLSNAIRYSPENGRVIIGARQQDEHHIELFVQDFGRGIDPRYHESIFERYFRVPGTKIQGSGLGLSISRDFVEAHSGTLTVDSELGKGSKFLVTLPV